MKIVLLLLVLINISLFSEENNISLKDTTKNINDTLSIINLDTNQINSKIIIDTFNLPLLFIQIKLFLWSLSSLARINFAVL
jgi:hypothetical protein